MRPGGCVAGIEDPTRKAALAQALFGRAGTQLLPMMARGAAGIEELQEQARALGLTMSTADATAAEDFTDALDALWKVVKMGVFQVGAALAPALQAMAKALTALAVKASAWIQANRQVVVTVAKVAAVVLVAGAALAALGVAVSAAGVVLGALAGVLSFVLSPLGLVIAAVTALGAALAGTSDLGAKAMDWLGKAFGWFREAAVTAISAVVFAIKNWRAVLEYAATAGVLQIVRFASQMRYFFAEVIPATLKWFADNWRDVFTTIWRFTKTVAVNIGRNLKTLWDAIMGFVKGEGWNFKWTPLLEGFESAVKQLPAIAERQIGPLESQLQKRVNELGGELAKEWQAHDAEFREKLGDSSLGKLLGIEGPAVEIKAPDLSGLQDTAELGGMELSRQAAQISAQGTFLTANVLGLQTGGASDRMANGIDKIERNTRSLRNADGITFA